MTWVTGGNWEGVVFQDEGTCDEEGAAWSSRADCLGALPVSVLCESCFIVARTKCLT